MKLPKQDEVAYHRRLRNKVAHESFKIDTVKAEAVHLFYEESIQLVKDAIEDPSLEFKNGMDDKNDKALKPLNREEKIRARRRREI